MKVQPILIAISSLQLPIFVESSIKVKRRDHAESIYAIVGHGTKMFCTVNAAQCAELGMVTGNSIKSPIADARPAAARASFSCEAAKVQVLVVHCSLKSKAS